VRACAALLWRNPQFGVTLTSPYADDKDRVAHMVVSLLQESLRSDENFSIGVMIYKVHTGALVSPTRKSKVKLGYIIVRSKAYIYIYIA